MTELGLTACLHTLIRVALVAIAALIVGCASNVNKITKSKHIPSNVTSISVDCNVRPLFSDRVFDVAWNANTCNRLQKIVANQAKEDSLPRGTPVATTVALGSAYLFQNESSRPLKAKAWRAKNHANLVGDLPLLSSARYQQQFDLVLARFIRDLSVRGRPVVNDVLPGALWAQAFDTERRELHLHVALSGFYDPPYGGTQNIQMSATLRNADGCVHGRGGWLFDFTPESRRTEGDVADVIAAQMLPSLLSATQDYGQWLEGRYRSTSCRN